MTRALVVSVCLLSGGVAHAQSLDAIFDEANAAAIRGDHAEAQRAYESLEAAGVLDPDVAFDLGTVHAQQGHYGEAIRYFERTLALRPGDADAEVGLTRARRVLADQLAAQEGEVELSQSSSLGEALVRDLSEPGLAWSFLVLWTLLFLALAGWRVLSARPRLIAATASVLLLVSTVACGVLLATKRGVFTQGEMAIVVDARASILEGPDPRARVRHRLLEGQRVQVVGEEPGYLRIRGPRGERGWADEESVGLVLP